MLIWATEQVENQGASVLLTEKIKQHLLQLIGTQACGFKPSKLSSLGEFSLTGGVVFARTPHPLVTPKSMLGVSLQPAMAEASHAAQEIFINIK